MKILDLIKWHSGETCRVMIFDGEGAELLMKCIPSGLKVSILNIRQGIPLIPSLSFLLLLIINIVRCKKLSTGLFSTIVTIWKPSAILSYIDNSRYLGYLQERFPEIAVISIQNGFRGDFSENKIDFNAGIYFSFGEMESELFLCNKYMYKEMYPIGSLRAGLAMKIQREQELFDICFISEYPSAADLKHAKSWDRELLEIISKAESELFDLVVRFAESRNLKLCVAMRSSKEADNYEEEKKFFTSKSRSDNLKVVPRHELSSYEVALASRLVVCLFSTLGYEMLGLGKKTLFSADCKSIADFFMRSSWAINYPAHQLPISQRIFNMDYFEFSKKATNLLNMTNKDYIESTRIARNYYMKIDLENRPHEIIKSYLSKLLL